MTMTRSHKTPDKEDGANRQQTMMSIQESEMADADTKKSPTETDMEIDKDSKRRRTIEDQAESPNQRSLKLAKPETLDLMEEETT
jgi:hypothetical protein